MPDVDLLICDVLMISRFHCVYWPAFLMALDLPLPRNVLTHGHWTMNRAKMSKSTGNVVNPFFAIDRFGVDPMRFFLAYQGAYMGDADYDNGHIIRDYKKMLQWGIGNLTHRTMGCAKWNLRPFVAAAATDELPPATARDEEHQSMLEEKPTRVAKLMENLNPKAALREIMKIIDKVCTPNYALSWLFSTNAFSQQTNKYFHAAEPWSAPAESQRIIYNVSESLRISGILLQPFMPSKSQELLDLLCVDTSDMSKRSFSASKFGSDLDYGDQVDKPNRKILFPPLVIEE